MAHVIRAQRRELGLHPCLELTKGRQANLQPRLCHATRLALTSRGSHVLSADPRQLEQLHHLAGVHIHPLLLLERVA